MTRGSLSSQTIVAAAAATRNASAAANAGSGRRRITLLALGLGPLDRGGDPAGEGDDARPPARGDVVVDRDDGAVADGLEPAPTGPRGHRLRRLGAALG